MKRSGGAMMDRALAGLNDFERKDETAIRVMLASQRNNAHERKAKHGTPTNIRVRTILDSIALAGPGGIEKKRVKVIP
jgi:hypothetical protein